MNPRWQSLFDSPDPTRFETFFEQHKALVWTICVRRLRVREDAEEAFQAVWLRLLAEGRAGRTPEEVSAEEWLCRLAGRESDALRKRVARRGKRESAMDVLPEVLDGGAGAVRSASEAETRRALERLVASLPEKLRLPAQLHYFHGMTIRQVAAALDVPTSTVDSRLAAARRQLKPMAERSGLRDALVVLLAGGMAGGLLVPPATLTAAAILAAPTAASVGTAGMVKAIAAIVALLVLSAGLLVVSGGREDAATSEPPEPAMAETSPPPPERIHAVVSIAVTTPSPTPVMPALLELPPSTPQPTPEIFVAVLVADAISGEPIANAEVRASTTGSSDGRVEWTNDEGVARFRGVPRMGLSFCVEADGYAAGAAATRPGTNDPIVTINLRRGAVLFGSVTDANGNPIAGVRVLYGFGGQTVCHRFPVTDEDGRWETAWLPQGDSVDGIMFLSDGYKRKQLPNPVAMTSGVTRHEINVQLERATGVRGIVVDADTGLPIPNARVGSSWWAAEAEARTDDEGRFELRKVNDFWVVVHADGYAPVGRNAFEEDPLRFELPAGLSVGGRVVDAEKRPVAGAQVEVTTLGSYRLLPVTTDAAGSFLIDGVAGNTELQVKADGWAEQPIFRRVAGRTDLEIVLRRVASVRGRVVDEATKEPVQRFTVELGAGAVQTEEIAYGVGSRKVQFDDRNGRFVFGSFPEWYIINVHIDAEGYERATVQQYAVGGSPLAIELKQLPEDELSGRVVDAGGAPIAGAEVALYTRARQASHPFSWETVHAVTDYALQAQRVLTGATGDFRFPRVAMPADADLIVKARGFGWHQVRLTERPAGPLTIALDREARLRVRVDRELHPAAFSLELLGQSGQADWSRIYLPGDEELIEVGDLPARSFLARAFASLQDSNKPIWNESITLTAGETLELEIGAPRLFALSGRFVEGGRPCCSGEEVLLAYDPSDARWGSLGGRFARILRAGQADGTFRFEDLEPGRYLLGVLGPSSGLSRTRMHVGLGIEVHEDTEGLTVERARGATLTGSFKSPMSGAMPQLIERVGSAGRAVGWIAVREGGEFRITDIPAGEYEIVLPGDRLATAFRVEGPGEVELGVVDAEVE